MVPIEVLPCIDSGGLMNLYLHSGQDIERRVAEALMRLTGYRPPSWKKVMRLTREESVAIELSLEDLAIILERVDLRRERQEDIAAT